jgi:hypothetical protein
MPPSDTGNLATDGYNFMITGSFTNTQELTASQRSFARPGLIRRADWTTSMGRREHGPGVIWTPTAMTGRPAFRLQGQSASEHVLGDCEYLYSAAVDLIPKENIASGLASFSKALPGNNTVSLQYFYTRTDTVTVDWT